MTIKVHATNAATVINFILEKIDRQQNVCYMRPNKKETL